MGRKDVAKRACGREERRASDVHVRVRGLGYSTVSAHAYVCASAACVFSALRTGDAPHTAWRSVLQIRLLMRNGRRGQRI
jgi:hypothetical protein